MPAINITDLNNAKTDVDHIAAIATSPALTVTDRLANTKKTIAGVVADADARLAANDARELAAFNTRNSAEATAFAGRNSLETATFNTRNSTAAAQVIAIQFAADAVIGNIAGITNRGAWAPATLYAGKDIVLNAGTWYICIVAHTSSAVFTTDAASKWRVYQGLVSADLAAPAGPGLVGHDATLNYMAGTLGRAINDASITVKMFPWLATGLGISDDTAAIAAAVTWLSANGGGKVIIPKGTYRTTANINVPSNITISGTNRAASVIEGTDKSHVGFTFTGNTSEINNVFIRGMSIGISCGAGRYCKLDNCIMSYNRIGVDWLDGYINTISRNNITFNSYGALLRGQSFQLLFNDNVVDNNLGGLGVLVLGSAGATILNNTIEGNRIEATGRGVGLFIASGVTQRLVVHNNWFEINGTAYLPSTTTPNDYSVDILIGDGISPLGAEIVATCVPSEYAASAAVTSAYGTIDIANNFHYASRIGVAMRLQSNTYNIQIHGMRYNGQPGRAQKPISITYINGGIGLGGLGGIDIHNNNITIEGSTVATELLGGIGGSYVWCTAVTPLNLVRVENVDLYTKRMTCTEFLALPGATLSPVARIPISGTASLTTTSRAQRGTSGVVTTAGTGRCRVGAAAVFTLGQIYYPIVIAKPGSALNFATAAGGAAVLCNDGARANAFTVVGPVDPTQVEATFGTGEYYGYCNLLAADEATYIKGAKRLELTDLQVVSDVTRGTVAPSSALQTCTAGDIVYNSAPVAGGSLGFVCVATGLSNAAGAWKTFGAISA